MTLTAAQLDRLRTCPTCGLAQLTPPLPMNSRAKCARCHTNLVRTASIRRSNQRTAAIALAALILYPLAILLPIVRVEQFGFVTENSILTGIGSLFATGHLMIGLVVLVCSVVVPLGKLLGLFILAAGGLALPHRHKAMTYRLVEWTGRWGMLDVLLVAILVAAVKVGDLVTIAAGPGVIAFGLVVVLSLAASASFDPHALWNSAERENA